ncbi:hypothetical protein [Bacillus phage SPO1L1]|nr:hypothetical protein [Bacillus phage SPO1L1]WIT25999.1 hypothetical protein [Bacillus phage SPO1L2]
MRVSHIVLSLLFVCFVCSQINCYIISKERDRINEENQEIKDTNQILLDKNTHLTDDLTDAKEKVKDLEKKVEDISKTSKKVEGQVKKLEKDKKDLEEDKASLQKKVKELSLKKSSSKSVSSKEDKKVASSTPSKDKPSEDKSLTMVATAYTASCAGCSGITTTGIDLRSNPDMKVIAVDPSIIPLGSRVHVEGYGYAIAGDTGGAIKGNKIDIFVPNRQDALAWGVRTVKVTY